MSRGKTEKISVVEKLTASRHCHVFGIFFESGFLQPRIFSNRRKDLMKRDLMYQRKIEGQINLKTDNDFGYVL
jgi:hypothetical protein